MRFSGFPACCTGHVILELGGTGTGAGYYSNRDNTEQDIKAFIHKSISAYPSHAFVAITTNNQQVLANKVLRELGASSSPWMSKKQHPETKVRIWWIHIPTYLER